MGIVEAPLDGKQYARQNASWTEIQGPEPITQNLQLVGTNSYKLLTSDDSNITHGNRSLLFSSGSGGSTVTLGDNSVTFGFSCISEGEGSMSGGSNSRASFSGGRSMAWGVNARASHDASFAFGFNVESTTDYSMVVGSRNSTEGTATSSIFTVGNGGWSSNSNALEVLMSGVILAPTLDMTKLDSAPDTALTTKEYVNSPSRLIEALTNATTSELNQIKSLLGIS